MSRFACLSFCLLASLPGLASAEIFVPGQSVPNVKGDVFTWEAGAANSTSAFWDTFADFPGGTVPGGIAPGTSPAANESFADGGTASELTFDSFASIISSGNAYGFNFGDNSGFQPQFITDAHATVRSGTSGGNYTRIVAQWQTQGSELDYSSFLLNDALDSEGTLTPDFLMETGRQSLGGFGGELVNHMAVWDLEESQEAFRLDFRAQANHMSLDQFRLDTYTQSTPFVSVTAIPEPSSVAFLGVVASSSLLRRKRRRQPAGSGQLG